jgi:hypothetical protein
MNDITYILRDPFVTETCVPFSIVDTGTDLTMLLLTIVDASTGAPPASLSLASLVE